MSEGAVELSVQAVFEHWAAGDMGFDERSRMCAVDENGDYILMQTRVAFNTFLAGYKAAKSSE